MPSTVEYQPVLDGVPYDPEPSGGEVTELALYASRAYSGSPLTYGPAVRVAAGRYQFTVPDSVTAGRYWPRITWTSEDGGGDLVDALTAPLDLPIRDDMVISPEDLAKKLGITLAELTEDQRDTLTEVIFDAQAEIEDRLGQPILPMVREERACYPHPSGWYLAYQPVLRILTEVEELDLYNAATGYWTVTYLAGLDAKNDPELRTIKRFLLQLAASKPESEAMWRAAGAGAAAGVGARVKSVSAEGQSVSYDYQTPVGGGSGSGSADTIGGALTWANLDQWSLVGKRAYQRAPARPVSIFSPW